MLEKLLTGPKTYYLWLLFLLAVIAGCGLVYLQQLQEGLSITGMSRDVSWGLYISQFTYLVGVAASAVMLVLPAYFHHYKKFKRMIIFGEFMAISAVVMCALFIVVDLGQPQRMMNVLLHPTPNSVMFYDMIVLIGYLTLNAVIGWVTLEAERHDVEPPKWIKPLIYLSILWAFSIHTVTGFLYAGIPGRHYWLTAIMAARFLASAFCSGPAILLLLLMAAHGKYSMAVKWAVGYCALLLFQQYILPASPKIIATSFTIFATYARRMFPCLMTGSLMLKCTPLRYFIVGLRQLRVPQRLIVAVSVTLRYFPAIREEMGYIRDAMKLRDVRGLARLEGTVIPLMVSATETAEELSAAAVTRGIEDPAPKTSAVFLRLSPVDLAGMAAGLVLLALSFVVQ